jgi:AraC-like DNA-binding protein
MHPKLEKIPVSSSSSITVKKEITSYMDYPWHYHPEFEIIFVEKSYGIRIMGNHTGNFDDGDLLFISPNLPHVWRNDNDFYQGNPNLGVVVYVIHFRENALGENFFRLPECNHIRELFLRGRQGIWIKGESHREISGLIRKVYHASGIDRLVLFLETLDAFAHAQDYELLSGPGYINSVNLSDAQRINKVINFLLEHYAQDINMEEIARLVNLNKSSFCRYFKARTHKTCTRFLNEIRIAHACKLLVNNRRAISQVCYETGYNNISHFNRQFKRITGTTAKAYVNEYLKAGY